MNIRHKIIEIDTYLILDLKGILLIVIKKRQNRGNLRSNNDFKINSKDLS
jgi:hypothetical protein